MPRRPASRRWAGPSHSGGPRAAAEPVADVAVIAIEPGPGLVARLRDALGDAPAAQRVLIHVGNPSSLNFPPPLAGEGRVRAVVYTLPMSDTVKEVMDGRVLRTVPRETLVQVTGPWVFEREALADALTRVPGTETEIVDMIGLCEAARIRVRALPAQ